MGGQGTSGGMGRPLEAPMGTQLLLLMTGPLELRGVTVKLLLEYGPLLLPELGQ